MCGLVIVLTEGRAEHAAAISAVHGQLFVPAWSASDVLSLLSGPGALALVAYGLPTGPLQGFILGQQAADEAEILSIGVAPEFQRRGLGYRLLADWMSLAAREGVVRVFLEVAADNVAAKALYGSLGFEQVGLRRNYYDRVGGDRCDALILAKKPSERGSVDG